MQKVIAILQLIITKQKLYHKLGLESLQLW